MILTPIFWLIKNWRISLYAILIVVIIGAYFRGVNDGHNSDAAKSLNVLSKIKEKQSAILANPPSINALISILLKHQF